MEDLDIINFVAEVAIILLWGTRKRMGGREKEWATRYSAILTSRNEIETRDLRAMNCGVYYLCNGSL